MYKALIYKEWIKIRWYFLIVLGVSLWQLTAFFLEQRELFELKHAVVIWNSIIFKKIQFYSEVKYSAVLAGMVLALAQFIPETLKQRLRLLFHLPVAHNNSVYTMIGVGLTGVVFIVFINVVVMSWIIATYYPWDVVRSALLTSAPWFISGLVAYFWVVLAALEPNQVRKILFGGAGFLILSLYLSSCSINAFEHSLWRYLLLALLLAPTAILPAHRFKRGLS
ncbi:MAG: hypothetical protein V1816_26420 [Pseudomonadota bacterium]